MVKVTDEAAVRSFTKVFARAVEIDKNSILARHPFTTAVVTVDENGKLADLRKEEDYRKWITGIDKLIDRTPIKTLFTVFIEDNWKLAWLKFVKSYLTKKDFAEFLGSAWVCAENPSMDPNVPISMLIRWFRKVDKIALMSDEDYRVWSTLPDTVTLYRGVSVGRKRYGLSWTQEREEAEWFKRRFEYGDRRGTLLTATVSKDLCLCYTPSAFHVSWAAASPVATGTWYTVLSKKLWWMPV